MSIPGRCELRRVYVVEIREEDGITSMYVLIKKNKTARLPTSRSAETFFPPEQHSLWALADLNH